MTEQIKNTPSDEEIYQRIQQLETKRDHSQYRTLLPMGVILVGLLAGAWALFGSRSILEEQNKTIAAQSGMLQQTQAELEAARNEIRAQTSELVLLREQAERSDEKLDYLNANVLRGEYESIIANQNLGERLQDLRELQTNQSGLLAADSEVISQLSIQVSETIASTVERIEADAAAELAEQERLRIEEEQRLEVERRRLEALQNVNPLLDERICLNRNCSNWILP